jgi:SAM-dependent methyltransferase
VLDIGCGDGQISRLAASLGADVVGVDPTWNQITVARERGGGPVYLRTGAAALPFAEGVVRHGRRVPRVRAHPRRRRCDRRGGTGARAGGQFSFFLNHPLLQTPNSGWIDDQILDPPEQYWRIGPYLVEDETVEEVEKDVFIPFIHRPLSRYVNALAGVGLHVERMDEPAPPPGFLAKAAEYEAAATIPRLLYLRLRKGS